MSDVAIVSRPEQMEGDFTPSIALDVDRTI